ncbi:MAG: ferric reductase-like transmembrane domain-containing protein, partial [Candidatus Izimaplasma sp.]|nr:ferric reductase-like transmembrane domain-containing protein [Candidatus Izimaplasma bacterium]
YLIELIGELDYIESWIGLIAFAIMIPLFITSFSKFRKKYKFAEWKKLHRWSYLAYSLVLVHVVLVSDFRDAVAYVVIFTPYLVMKLKKEYKFYIVKKVKATA